MSQPLNEVKAGRKKAAVPSPLILRGLPLFSNLPEELLHRLWKDTDVVVYTRGDTVFSEDEQCQNLHVVVSGSVRIYKLSEDGREKTIHVTRSGSFFGEDIFGGDRCEAHAEALSESILLNIRKGALESLVLEYPPFALSLLANFGRRLKQLMMLIGETALQDVRKRLCRVLLELAEEEGEKRSDGPVIRIRHTDLAAYVGTARETLSRALRQLEQDRLIVRRNCRIILRNLPGLQREVPHWRENAQLFPLDPDRFRRK